jgi:hypothetical protein
VIPRDLAAVPESPRERHTFNHAGRWRDLEERALPSVEAKMPKLVDRANAEKIVKQVLGRPAAESPNTAKFREINQPAQVRCDVVSELFETASRGARTARNAIAFSPRNC